MQPTANSAASKKALVRSLALAMLVALAIPAIANAQIEITLKNTFIEKYKNRATIDATFTVDKAHARPNPASKDGDLHVAGRAPEIQLATVAEIMNAKLEQDAVVAIHQAESSGDPIKLTGAWRIWCEHSGSDEQTQGEALEPFGTTNPPHVFEIHPITSIQGKPILDSLQDIAGFTKKDADTAFARYEGMECEIQRGKTTTKIITRGLGFNYAEFWIEILDKQQHVIPDGRTLYANVLNGAGDADVDIVATKRRMVFVAGSKPELAVRSLHAGDQMHVIGIPRIDLSLVSYRTRNAARKPEMLKWHLPYEMIIVAVLE